MTPLLESDQTWFTVHWLLLKGRYKIKLFEVKVKLRSFVSSVDNTIYNSLCLMYTELGIVVTLREYITLLILRVKIKLFPMRCLKIFA